MKHEEISFKSSGNIEIIGDIVYPNNKEMKHPLIIKLHGFPGDATKILENELKLVRNRFAIMAFDFRGHRESEGEFSLKGEIDDTLAALDFASKLNNVDVNRIGLYGESMGGAVAICASVQDNRVKALCCRAPVFDTEYLFIKRYKDWFKPVVEIMRHDPFFKQEVRGLERESIFKELKDEARQYNPMNEITKLKIPIRIIGGTIDELLDFSKIKKLFDIANEPKDLIEVKEADHNLSSIIAYEKVGKAVLDFFMKYL
ncbi:MAG: alpha/beta hydrolase [Candidatus Helarchaeota archaeon]